MADWISVEEAAALSGYNAEHIRRLVREGQISAEKKGWMWWIDRKSLTAYLQDSHKSDDQRRGPKKK